MSGNRQKRGAALLARAAIVTAWLAGGLAFAQEEGPDALAERSAIVVRGKVVRTNASAEPMVAASPSTAVISILKMYAGAEIAGDQTGRTATVILSRPGRLKAGEQALFFGNPRFVGTSLTIADEGEISSNAAIAEPALQRGLQARRDRPVVERLATASLVFRGTVDSVRPLEEATPAAAEQGRRPPARPSEHDPEWQAATVKVATPLKGAEAGQTVTVLFAASRDIVWFQAPKLKAGQEAVFITHALSREEAAAPKGSGLAALLERQPAGVHAVTHPFDVLPPSDEARVRGLLSGGKEVK